MSKRRDRDSFSVINAKRPDLTSEWTIKDPRRQRRYWKPAKRTSPDGVRVYHFMGGRDDAPLLSTLYAELPPKHRRWLEKIVELIISTGLYKKSARELQEEAPFHGCSFQVEHNAYISFTWRAWGDIAQAAEGEVKRAEGYKGFVNKGYLNFYC